MDDDEPDLSTPPPPEAPSLPGVRSPPPEEVLDSVPSKEEVIGGASTARDIVGEQPSVDELLGRGDSGP